MTLTFVWPVPHCYVTGTLYRITFVFVQVLTAQIEELWVQFPQAQKMCIISLQHWAVLNAGGWILPLKAAHVDWLKQTIYENDIPSEIIAILWLIHFYRDSVTIFLLWAHSDTFKDNLKLTLACPIFQIFALFLFTFTAPKLPHPLQLAGVFCDKPLISLLYATCPAPYTEMCWWT